MNPQQIHKYRGEWCQVAVRSPDGECVTYQKAMPREQNEGVWRFTTNGFEVFVASSDVISVRPARRGA